MALSLELSTDKAVKALASFDKALANTERKMVAFNNALGKTGTAAGQFSAGAQKAATSARQLGTAANSAGTGFTKLSATARTTKSSMVGLGVSMTSVRNIAAGMGVTLGAIALGRLVRDTFQLSAAFKRIDILFNQATNSATGGAKAIAFLKDTARRTAIDIDALAQSYSTFGYNAIQAGLSVKDTEQVFGTLAATMRVLNLNAEQSKRTFKGFEQVINKGVFSMEEIRQQIGENVPALKALERAAGLTGKELQDAMRNGAIGVEYLMPLMKEFNRQYAKLLPEAMKTTQAGMQLVTNEFKFMAEAFGTPLFDALAPSLHRFAQALQNMNDEQEETIKKAGELAGKAIGALVDGFTWLAQNADIVGAAFKGLMQGIAAVMALRVSMWLGGIIDKMLTFGPTIGKAAQTFYTLYATMNTTGTAIGGVSAVIRTVIGLMTGWLPVILAIVAAVAVFAAGWAAWTVATNDAGTAGEILGDALIWLGEQFGYTEAEVVSAVQGFVKWIDGILDAGKWADWFGAGLESWIFQPLRELKAGFDIIGTMLTSKWKQWWQSAGSIVSSIASQIVGAVQRIIDIVKAAIRALTSLSSKQASSGGGKTKAPQASSGGISHKMHRTNPTKSVPSAAFVGAPHFQNGGVTGSRGIGGIPAILHPNEAVIPLQGGSVPVSISGGDKSVTKAIESNNKFLSNIQKARPEESIDSRKLDLDKLVAYADAIGKSEATRAKATSRQRREAEDAFVGSGSSMSPSDIDMLKQAIDASVARRAVANAPAGTISNLPTDIQQEIASIGDTTARAVRTAVSPLENMGNTGLGWDVKTSSMKHYKAAFAAVKLGLPVSMLPGAVPGAGAVLGGPEKLPLRVRARIGARQMTQETAYTGLALYKAMAKEGMGFDAGIAKAYGQGAKHARKPPKTFKQKEIERLKSLPENQPGTMEYAIKNGVSFDDYAKAVGQQKWRLTLPGAAGSMLGGYTIDRNWVAMRNMWDAMSGVPLSEQQYNDINAKRVGRAMNWGEYLQKQRSAKMTEIINAGGGQKELTDEIDKRMKSASTGMMTGTANTSRDRRFRNAPSVGDGMGGRSVTLHPNEAVIPLRNGSVPVMLGTRALGQGGAGEMTAPGARGGTTIVKMDIHAKDVESFRRSQRQLMQDMSVEMRRANQEIGVPAGEDLTKIRNAPPRKY